MRRFLTLAPLPSTARRKSPWAIAVLAGAGFVSVAATPPPVPGGRIGTLEMGKYTCERPGDAGGPIQVPARELDFTVVFGSSYKAGGQRGSYLLTGDSVVMTGGALRGLKLHRINDGFLRRVDESGRDSEVRCVLATPGNG